MDKETLAILDDIVVRAADTAVSNAVAKMREFHLDDLKVLGERMDIGFESVNRRIDGVDERLDGIDTRLDGIDIRLDGIDTRLDRVENALDSLLHEFKAHREEVTILKKQISDLTVRVTFLEEKLAAVS